MSDEKTIVVGGDLGKLSVLEELVLSYKPSLNLTLVKDKGEKELKASYKKIKEDHIACKQARTQIKKAKSDLLEPAKQFTAEVNAMAKNLDEGLLEVVNYLTPLRDEYEAEEKARKAQEKLDKEAEAKAKEEEHAKVVAEKESELDKANKRIAELEAKFEADALAKSNKATAEKVDVVESKNEQSVVIEHTSTEPDLPSSPEPSIQVEAKELTEVEFVKHYLSTIQKLQHVEILENDTHPMRKFKAVINGKAEGFNEKIDNFIKGIDNILNTKF